MYINDNIRTSEASERIEIGGHFMYQLPSAEFVNRSIENGLSQYGFDEIIETITRVNEVNSAYDTAKASVSEKVFAPMAGIDYFSWNDEMIARSASWNACLEKIQIDGVSISGQNGHGSSELYPLRRIEKDIKKLERKIKMIAKYGETLY